MNEELIIRHGAVREPAAETEIMEERYSRGRSLAMVYSPAQRFQKLFEPMEALLRRGTVFRDLYKPFLPGGRSL